VLATDHGHGRDRELQEFLLLLTLPGGRAERMKNGAECYPDAEPQKTPDRDAKEEVCHTGRIPQPGQTTWRGGGSTSIRSSGPPLPVVRQYSRASVVESTWSSYFPFGNDDNSSR